MFTIDDEVEIIANNHRKENDRLIGIRGVVEEVDENGIWVSPFDLDDNNWYLCEESELKLITFP